MPKLIAAEKVRAGLRHAVVVPHPNVTGRTKDRIAQSKHARAGSLTTYLISHKWRQLVSSGPFFWCADAMLPFSGGNLYPPDVFSGVPMLCHPFLGLRFFSSLFCFVSFFYLFFFLSAVQLFFDMPDWRSISSGTVQNSTVQHSTVQYNRVTSQITVNRVRRS